jgi:hypothetical protein
MHGPINFKSPNNTSKWQMGFNSAFKELRDMIVANYIVAPVYGNIYRSLRPKDITSDQTDGQRETEQFAVLLNILYVRVDTKEGNRMCPERPDTVASFHVLTELY